MATVCEELVKMTSDVNVHSLMESAAVMPSGLVDLLDNG